MTADGVVSLCCPFLAGQSVTKPIFFTRIIVGKPPGQYMENGWRKRAVRITKKRWGQISNLSPSRFRRGGFKTRPYKRNYDLTARTVNDGPSNTRPPDSAATVCAAA